MSGSATAASSQGEQWRGHINEHSVFDLNETYRTGLDVQRVSDQTYLLRFGFGNPLLNAMVSRAYLEGFEARASTDVNAYLFQPLLPGIGDSTQPIVLPVANRNWQSRAGRTRRPLEPQRQPSRHRSRGRHPDPPPVARLGMGPQLPRSVSADNTIFPRACAATAIRSPI